MITLTILSILLKLTISQDQCRYIVGGLELDLTQFIGQTLSYTGNNGHYRYSICTNKIECEANSKQTIDMVSYYPEGLNECFNTASFDDQIRPFFERYIGSWVFNYTGGFCNQPSLQTRRSTMIAWNCNPDIENPFISEVWHQNACTDFLQVEWKGACVDAPPPNLDCTFKSGLLGGKKLNLSSLQGTKLEYKDEHGATWGISPCANAYTCQFQNGASFPAMSEVQDSSGQCAKILGVWSGDDQSFYDRTVFGQDYWEFFWMNGMECTEGGPTELLNARYYCNTTVSETTIRFAGPKGGPCQFRFEIDTPLAC